MIHSSRYLDIKFSDAMSCYQSGDIRGMRRIAHYLRKETSDSSNLREGIRVTADNIDRIATELETDIEAARRGELGTVIE